MKTSPHFHFSGIPERVHAPGQPRAAPRQREGGGLARGRLQPHLARRERRAHRQGNIHLRRPLWGTPKAEEITEKLLECDSGKR